MKYVIMACHYVLVMHGFNALLIIATAALMNYITIKHIVYHLYLAKDERFTALIKIKITLHLKYNTAQRQCCIHLHECIFSH